MISHHTCGVKVVFDQPEEFYGAPNIDQNRFVLGTG